MGEVLKPVGKVFGSILGLEAPQMPANVAQALEKPPVLDKPKEMPVADDDKVRAARRRSLAEQRKRGGRASTMLTDVEALGG